MYSLYFDMTRYCSCRSETFSTLRFAQRAKAIKNKAVVNEVMHDDVNHLREVIRQLRVYISSTVLSHLFFSVHEICFEQIIKCKKSIG